MPLIQIYRLIINTLKRKRAFSQNDKKRTREISDSIGKTNSRRVLPALKKLEKGGIVNKYPRKTKPKPILLRKVGNKTSFFSKVGYSLDCDYINGLTLKNNDAKAILKGVNLSSLNMWNREYRQQYNNIVEKLRASGLNSKLANYGFVGPSYHWWLTPNWSAKFKQFLKKESKRVRNKKAK